MAKLSFLLECFALGVRVREDQPPKAPFLGGLWAARAWIHSVDSGFGFIRQGIRRVFCGRLANFVLTGPGFPAPAPLGVESRWPLLRPACREDLLARSLAKVSGFAFVLTAPEVIRSTQVSRKARSPLSGWQLVLYVLFAPTHVRFAPHCV